MPILRRTFICANALTGLLGSALSWASTWPETLSQARGQTVRFNAWAGSEAINAYIQWAATEVQTRFGVRLQHIKINDAAEVVKRVRAEKAAGQLSKGSTDLLWINGENFAAMKREGLLYGPFTALLPNFAAVDTLGKPTTLLDFSVPTDGFESPWGMAQLTWFADAQRLPQRPQSMADLMKLAQQQAGRLSYPRPPDFHGTTFLKQALSELSPQRADLYKPVDADAFARHTAPLWAFLDALHPHLWRQGRQFPNNAAQLRQMMADGELLLGLTFNPNEAANEIAAGRLPKTVVSWQFAGGTIANTHFVAIPFNSPATAASKVVADFLLSPEAQARKADIAVWGDPTVLAVDRLPAQQARLFQGQRHAGQVQAPAPGLPEPHASWVEALEKAWTQRYGT